MAKKFKEELYRDYQASLGAMESIHNSFEQKEKMLASQPIDKISKEETKSGVSDPTLLSATLKQNNSVMAQMPSGKIVALTKQNKGKSLFMDIIFKNHVLPNANSQHDVYTKLWMLSFYRKVYGSMGVLVDYVRGGGYGKDNAGPDFTVLPIRSIIPQIGKYSETDCDYLYVRSRVSKKWLENRKSDNNWKNIGKVLDQKGDYIQEYNTSSHTERKSGSGTFKRGEYELITRYEPDKWTTFHPSTREIVREIGNSQKNDKIPVIMCHSYPLIDRFIGLGDFERGVDLYSSLGSLISLYLDGAKAGIFPNLKIDPAAVENWSDIKKNGLSVGQVWLMKKNMFDRLEQMHVKPDLATFQSTYNFLKAAVLTLTNTTDTGVSGATDPGFGKTPQALKMQAFSQGMQTQFDRRMLEISTEKIFDRMINLIAKKQEKPMKLYLKEADLLAVQDIAPDVVEMFDVGNMGQVTIKATDVKDVEYRYEIDQGSTVKKDEILENESIKDITTFILKNVPNASEALAKDGKVPLGTKSFDLGEAIKRLTISSGITDPDKIIVDNQNVSQNDLNMEETDTAAAVTDAFIPPQGPQPITNQGEQTDLSDPLLVNTMTELEGLASGGVV